MKKIILILFLFFFLICFLCYQIYNITERKNIYVLSIGDEIADINYLKQNKNKNYKYNNTFINKDYRIIDLLTLIKYNQEQEINNKIISIHQLLKETDILIISIGMNDIYYKLYDDTRNIYTYINEIINNYESILSIVNRYNYKRVYVLGYYNTSNSYTDIYTYANYKLNKIVNKYKYTFIDLNKIIGNNSKFIEKNSPFDLNNEGKHEIYKFIVENLKKS